MSDRKPSRTAHKAAATQGQEPSPGDARPLVILVGGPTASGKSALASAIAGAFDGTVINADSMQIYRGIEILTAQPDAQAQAAVPHRLYGDLPPSEACSVGRWRTLAVAEIDASLAAGRMPVLAGGTGLYLRSLMQGLAPVPDVPAGVRERASARMSALGPAGLHAELARRDPALALRLRPTDRQRIQRAWEVIEATGRSLADWQSETPGEPRYRFLPVILMPPRELVYPACDARFAGMIEAGAVDEVRRLLALKLDPMLPAMKAVGVRELAAFLAGRLSLAEATAKGQQATRNYAKRQYTWFGNQMSPEKTGSLTYFEQYSESLAQRIFANIRLCC
ncbi:MAG: tRNA (adenosine(37)-N6)-dimethylallyltransferase MiaA [Alphaproteobacteria bacterium]